MYLALGDGPPGFRPGFTCPALLGVLVGDCTTFKYGTVTLYGSAFQRILLTDNFVTPYDKPHNPSLPKQRGLGYFRFARRYSGSRFYFLFLQVLRCFSSLR